MSINSHQCQVAIGETIDVNRANFEVNNVSSSTLYTGRVFRLNGGVAAEGAQTGGAAPAYIAYRGVGRPSSGGVYVVSSSATGGWLPGETAGNGIVAGIPCALGYTVLTSEYDSSRSYSAGDPVLCQTGSGAITNRSPHQGTINTNNATAGSNGVLGFVVTAPGDVNSGLDVNMIKIQLKEVQPATT